MYLFFAIRANEDLDNFGRVLTADFGLALAVALIFVVAVVVLGLVPADPVVDSLLLVVAAVGRHLYALDVFPGVFAGLDLVHGVAHSF